MVNLILLVLAFVLLLLEAFRPAVVVSPRFPQLGWLGLALFVLTFVLNGAGVR
jgi:uncharacterized membrane protein (DUF485 family)